MKFKGLFTVWIALSAVCSASVAQATEAVGTDLYPKDLSSFVLYAGEFLSVNDRAVVNTQAGGISSSDIYGKKVEIGVDAVTSTAWAGINGVTLRDRATVSDTLFYSGTLTEQSRTTVVGKYVKLPSLSIPSLSFIDKTYTGFPSTCPQGSVSIEPSDPNYPANIKTVTLAPGSYCSVSVKSYSKLILNSCDDYYFTGQLTLEPDSILEVRGGECGRATRIYVGGKIIYRGKTYVKPGETIAPEKLLFVSFTTGVNYIERPFVGTIIAPLGTILISMSVQQGTLPIFWGAALAGKNLVVHQGSIVLPKTAAAGILAGKGLSIDGNSKPSYDWNNGVPGKGEIVDGDGEIAMQFGIIRLALDFLYVFDNSSMWRISMIDEYSASGRLGTFGTTCAPYLSNLESSGFQNLESGDECVVLDIAGVPPVNLVMTGIVTRDPIDDGQTFRILSSLDTNYYDPDDLCSLNNASLELAPGKKIAALNERLRIPSGLSSPNTEIHMNYAVWNTDDWITYPELSTTSDGIVMTMVDYDSAFTCTSSPYFNARAFWTDSETLLFKNMIPTSIRPLEDWCPPSEYDYCAAMYANLSGADNVSNLIGEIDVSTIEITNYEYGDPLIAFNYHWENPTDDPVENTQIITLNDAYAQPCPFGCVENGNCIDSVFGSATLHKEFFCWSSTGSVCCEFE